MNKTERKMLDILKCLKNEHNIIAIKAEFEAEGSRTDELVMLNEIIFRADMKLYIKIGGCEAVRDLDQCRMLGASGIMAPMMTLLRLSPKPILYETRHKSVAISALQMPPTILER